MLKLETLQPTGSFKVRGALVAVAAAVAEDPDRPVVTASAGNHGLGVAFAAQGSGLRAVVVIPENASEAKRAALERFDVEIVRHGMTYDEAEAHALALAAGGARFISAYNDPDVIAGQGTIALELFDQVPGLTTIIAPVGGGGLVAGLALAADGTDRGRRARRRGRRLAGRQCGGGRRSGGHRPRRAHPGRRAGRQHRTGVGDRAPDRPRRGTAGGGGRAVDRRGGPVPGLRARAGGRTVGSGGGGRPVERRVSSPVRDPPPWW